MKESEAWDLLGQHIEEYATEFQSAAQGGQYLCFYFEGLLRHPMIGVGILSQMQDRFKQHHETDNLLNVSDKWNPPSWYKDNTEGPYTITTMNQWRILFCYAMAWEAWEEEQQTP